MMIHTVNAFYLAMHVSFRSRETGLHFTRWDYSGMVDKFTHSQIPMTTILLEYKTSPEHLSRGPNCGHKLTLIYNPYTNRDRRQFSGRGRYPEVTFCSQSTSIVVNGIISKWLSPPGAIICRSLRESSTLRVNAYRIYIRPNYDNS